MDPYDAIIVAHGQPNAPAPAEAALAAYASKVQAGLPGFRLGSASRADPGRLEAALGQVREGGLIYPMFMSDGWFVRTALADRLGDAPVTVMSPFGMDPDLPRIIARALMGREGRNRRPIVLIGHGSANGRPAPERATRDFAFALENILRGAVIKVGFLEQSPSIADAMASLPDELRNDAICVPFFATEGDHVRKDIPAELDAIGFTGQVLSTISDFPGVDAMIAAAILQALHDASESA